MTDTLVVEIAKGVALLRLNRPGAMNALSRELRLALVETLAKVDADPSVRVVILTGTGRAFCAGLDVKELRASGSNVTENIEGGDLGGAITAMKKPVIAAVNGLAVTGGFEIALACDILLAAESAYFADTHVRIGLLPGWGLSQRLSRTIGLSRAKEISLTARKVSADEAAALGFVSRVVPDADLMAAAMDLANAIAGFEARNSQAVKALMDKGFAKPFDEALKLEVEMSRDFNSSVVLTEGKAK